MSSYIGGCRMESYHGTRVNYQFNENKGCSGSRTYGPSFAYSLFVHSFHACRDRVVLSATVQFVWRRHAETPTTRAGPWPDFALRLE